MVIILCGESGSGKDTIKDWLVKNGYENIVSYTTRSSREGEKDGVDYHFISNSCFEFMKNNGLMAENEEYSQDRLYGTLTADYITNPANDKVVILTPNGVRQAKKTLDVNNIQYKVIYITCPLGVRMKRYIDRIGDKDFTFSDKDELASRVERDFGMFMGMKQIADLTIVNDNDTSIAEHTSNIIKFCKESVVEA